MNIYSILNQTNGKAGRFKFLGHAEEITLNIKD